MNKGPRFNRPKSLQTETKSATFSTKDHLISPQVPSKKSILPQLLSIFLVFVIGFGVGTYKDSLAAGSMDQFRFLFGDLDGTPAEVLDLEPLWQVWNLLETRFVTTDSEPTAQEKVEGLIRGLADSYNDPYTEFFNEEELLRFNENLEGSSFSGVGMEIGLTKDGLLRVVAPLPETPADRAGIKAGDIIMKIDDTNALDISIDEALSLIRGPEGSQVELTIAREGERQPLVFAVTRNTIDIPILRTRIEDEVFIISLYSFSVDVNDKFRDALNQYRDSDTRGLIVDLRNNPGGYLNSAVELGSWFVSAGEVLVREKSERIGADGEKLYRSKGYHADILSKKPVVVLVNQGSASASEILAGIISDYEVGTVVGEPTFGKGSVQELVPVKNRSAVKITTARWFTPSGVSISDNGLEPEVVIKDDPATVDIDEQLELAIQEILSK